jgi:transposase
VEENEQRLRPKQLLREGDSVAVVEPPAKKRRPTSAKRLSGGGRKPALTAEQERWLRDWVLSLRRCEHHFAVAEIHIQLAARAKYGIKAGDKWVQGFMKRQGFSMRLRTTAKEVTTQSMQEIGFHWRNKFAPVFMQNHPYLLLNMDETSMYLDAPSNRTVDEIGAKTVEIGTTHHYKSRLAVLLCIDFQGRMLTPLVVYRCYEKKKLVKTHQFFKKTIMADGKPFDIWVTYARKAWLNATIMVKWLEQVYIPHLQATGQDISKSILFLDNCSAHKTEECLAFFSLAGVGYEFFPPHCTPILQPLDQTVNREFKREYEKEWAKWFQETGCFGRTPKGNRKAATEDEVNVWVAHKMSIVLPHVACSYVRD